MNITEKWNALLDKMKQLWNNEMAEINNPAETTEENPTEDHPTDIDEDLSEKTEPEEKEKSENTIEEMKQDSLEEKQLIIQDEVDREIRQARSEAIASGTMQKEDPSVHEFKQSPNRMAYDEDAKLFK